MAAKTIKATEPERSARITIGGAEHELILSTRATKEIAKRYGGLDNLGEKLLKAENFELALEEIVWLITLLANQSILIHNLRHQNEQREPLTEDEVELLTTPLELSGFKAAITEAMFRGTSRNILSEDSDGGQKNAKSRVNSDELFTRLYYYGTVLMGMGADDFWLMPIGLFLDLWTCHKQWLGLETARKQWSIDDVIPLDI